MDKENKKIIKCQINDDEFQKYNMIIDSDIENSRILKHDNSDFKKYEGNIEKDLYNGRGILYSRYGEIIYKGFFKNGKYEGFGKKYEENQLIYEGFFKNGEYHGIGKLYEKEMTYTYRGDYKYTLKYEGEFNKGIFEGYGKLYKKFYNSIYYEGNFTNGEIKGKGIKYYKNGKKKLEGTFEENNIFEGKYYSPEGKVIFEGKIINNIFYNSNYLEIYNDNGFILYKDKMDNINNKVELYNNLKLLKNTLLSRDKALNNNEEYNNLNENEFNIAFISENFSGKSSLITRLIENKFYEDKIIQGKYGPSQINYNYVYNNKEYIVNIWNLRGNLKFHNIKLSYLKNSDVIIYTIDITIDDINEIFLNDLYENMQKDNKCIYIVLTKIDLNDKNLEPSRKLAQKLIMDGKIYRYFEVSSKTGEGIESFIKCLKFDIAFSPELNKKNDYEYFKIKLYKYLNY